VFAPEENLREPPIALGLRLLDLFDANLWGRGLLAREAAPLISQPAAEELRLPPSTCVVVVAVASVGIRAARAGGMAAPASPARTTRRCWRDPGLTWS
jgi:beta-phosphoglucomutase-like phosphatase (HAD superfamily)